MGYPLSLALRYMNSKKGAFISVGTAFAILGVSLGVAALAIVMSVTGGFQAQFREKVLGVNAHVLVMKYSPDFREYREVMAQVAELPGVTGAGPFIINPMMVSHSNKTATGVLVKGVDPAQMPRVLDLPKHLREGSLVGLRKEGALPAGRPASRPPTRPATAPSLAGSPGQGEPLRDRIDALEGVDGVGDAGHNLPLLRAIEATLAEDERAEKLAPRRVIEPPVVVAEPAPPPLPASAPRGSVEPASGYQSKLPDDDALPPEIGADPCENAQEVAKMPGIVVGTTLLRNLDMKIGDCVEVTSPTIGFSFNQGAIRPPVMRRFRVIATFEAGFDQYDSKLVYVDLYEAQSFYDQGDTVTGIEMRVSDIEKARSIARDIDKILSNGLYHTMDWEELNHGLFTALRIQQIGMSFVLSLIILVAAFTVVATLIMVVLDKKKEIAVLKAMGAKNTAILRTFLYQGGFIGLVGTAVGLSIGYGVCRGLLIYAFPLDPKVYFISRLPVIVRPQEFLMTGAIAIVICLAATVVPAMYAARLRPADGLRDQ